jgi:hypothetical protein
MDPTQTYLKPIKNHLDLEQNLIGLLDRYLIGLLDRYLIGLFDRYLILFIVVCFD